MIREVCDRWQEIFAAIHSHMAEPYGTMGTARDPAIALTNQIIPAASKSILPCGPCLSLCARTYSRRLEALRRGSLSVEHLSRCYAGTASFLLFCLMSTPQIFTRRYTIVRPGPPLFGPALPILPPAGRKYASSFAAGQ